MIPLIFKKVIFADKMGSKSLVSMISLERLYFGKQWLSVCAVLNSL